VQCTSLACLVGLATLTVVFQSSIIYAVVKFHSCLLTFIIKDIEPCLVDKRFIKRVPKYFSEKLPENILFFLTKFSLSFLVIILNTYILLVKKSVRPTLSD
jgi:hypothetical protein